MIASTESSLTVPNATVWTQTPTSVYTLCGKRMMDIALSLVLILCFAPVMLIIWCVNKFNAPELPAVFHQLRVGTGGSLFNMYKFRSMTICEFNPEKDDGSWYPEEKKITRFGKFLRKTRLDELPQLFNVLYGHMSMVGPRPDPMNASREFMMLREDYSQRISVKPGMTGWAQVNGKRNRDFESMMISVEYDREYVQAITLLFDLHVIFRTPLTMLTGRGAN